MKIKDKNLIRDRLALPPEWNGMLDIGKVSIKKDTKIFVGKIEPQIIKKGKKPETIFVGGEDQIFADFKTINNKNKVIFHEPEKIIWK